MLVGNGYQLGVNSIGTGLYRNNSGVVFLTISVASQLWDKCFSWLLLFFLWYRNETPQSLQIILFVVVIV